ncbi:MAG TPA: hypothetical protein GX497_16845 [Bacillus bacterium]|nr:hypothetical protein [Bacillus sp. (in: firmicutes)]
MADQARVQLNLRVRKDTIEKLDEIVEFYQKNIKFGRVYKGDVLTDIIEKAHALMLKQSHYNKQY